MLLIEAAALLHSATCLVIVCSAAEAFCLEERRNLQTRRDNLKMYKPRAVGPLLSLLHGRRRFHTDLAAAMVTMAADGLAAHSSDLGGQKGNLLHAE